MDTQENTIGINFLTHAHPPRIQKQHNGGEWRGGTTFALGVVDALRFLPPRQPQAIHQPKKHTNHKPFINLKKKNYNILSTTVSVGSGLETQNSPALFSHFQTCWLARHSGSGVGSTRRPPASPPARPQPSSSSGRCQPPPPLASAAVDQILVQVWARAGARARGAWIRGRRGGCVWVC